MYLLRYLLKLPTIIGFAETNLLLLPRPVKLKSFSLNNKYTYIYFIIPLTNNKYYTVLTMKIFLINFPFFKALATAGLVTPICLAAAVKLSKDNFSLVSVLITSTFTPIRLIADLAIFARVFSESFIPFRLVDILSLITCGNILTLAAIDSLFLASSLSIRPSLKNFKVSSVCL
uniref:GIY-YIG endonuclease n=1 Tax=Ophiocordyceps sinensis TaxID=72228 RepID=A0A1X8VJL3_9HYPO|nr:GIY-YIG endonuclease [Ophiocordyceps sinensis]ARF03383.1 GIY-YIG endonuclease [Ophiocordyceps sinensis]QDH07208.1 GIY-YIG endonuclease [Ophiocordyceps sinensis]